MNRPFSNKRGSTLIEVMGTVLIFMVGIAALLGVFYASTGMAKRAQYAYTAYNIAKNHIEDLKAFTFTDLVVANETASIVDQNGVSDPNGQYIRTTAITPSYNSDAGLTKIDVQVWYVMRGVQSQTSTQLTTVIFQSG